MLTTIIGSQEIGSHDCSSCDALDDRLWWGLESMDRECFKSSSREIQNSINQFKSDDVVSIVVVDAAS